MIFDAKWQNFCIRKIPMPMLVWTRKASDWMSMCVMGKVQFTTSKCRLWIQKNCPNEAVDLFEKGRHIYTFENICKEDNSVFLKDGAVKIFLNADSDQDDVSKELKAFLDYVAGKKSEDDYVQRLKEALEQARKNREWRHEYMTLLMRDQENMEKGMEKGKIEGRAEEIIESGFEFGLSEKDILTRLQNKLDISLQAAQQYLLRFGKQMV